MKLKKIELTAGRHTPIPDIGNWRNVSMHTLDGVDYKVGEYSGTDTTIEDYTGVWPIVDIIIDPTPLTPYQFRSLFPQLKKILIDRAEANIDNAPKFSLDVPGYMTEVMTGITLQDAMRSMFKDMATTPTIRRTSSETVASLGLLVVAGLLTEDEVNVILTKELTTGI